MTHFGPRYIGLRRLDCADEGIGAVGGYGDAPRARASVTGISARAAVAAAPIPGFFFSISAMNSGVRADISKPREIGD